MPLWQIWRLKSNSQQKTNMFQTLTLRLLFISKSTPVSSRIIPDSSPRLWSVHVHSHVRRLSKKLGGCCFASSLSEGVCSPYKAPFFIKHCDFLSRSPPITSCFSSGTKQQWWLDKRQTVKHLKGEDSSWTTSWLLLSKDLPERCGNRKHKSSDQTLIFKLWLQWLRAWRNTQSWWRKKAEMKEPYFNFLLKCFYQSCVERMIH